ncbi:MAG: NAD(P)-binding protein [Opitutaceae bacterium]|nr:NAD(P)-binding protein [Opitutaceae bacterium]
MIYDYLIIGGGITGISVARLLQLSGVEKIHVLEASTEPGGLCRTRQIGSHVLDVGGGHFLCTKFPEVYDFVFAHIPKSEFNYFNRVSKVEIGQHQVDYPLENNIWQLPAKECADYLISIAQNGEARGQPEPSHFDAWIRWKLGNRIAEDYMIPYNRKIWGVEASEMDIDWLHKIPRLDVREIAMACLSRKADPSAMPSHAGFYYPKRGGFQRIFDAILAPVSAYVECAAPVERIERSGDLLVVNGRHRARRVINTAPWHALASSPIFDALTRADIARLRANQIVVSLHEAPLSTDAHWLYQPDESLSHHRSFFIHNFAPHSAREGVYRETNHRRWQSGVGELYFENNHYAYPIPTLGWANAIDRVLAQALRHEVYGVGRWGQWQYLNSDVCIHEAMKLVSRLGHIVSSVPRV